MQDFFGRIGGFWNEISLFLGISDAVITVVGVVEILIISFLIYNILIWIKNTRAWDLFKGIGIILIFVLIAAFFQMNTILWLAENLLSVGLIMLVVIFQPELRKALENLGTRNFFGRFFSLGKKDVEKFSDHTVEELVKASFSMGKVKTGALIVIEDEIDLGEYIRTGIDVDAVVSSQLLINIFEKNTPLHDGAVIIRGDRIVSATCYLPLSDSLQLSKALGTRHRAAVGISEASDSMTIIVSEETGTVSVAYKGQIYRDLDGEGLRTKLHYAQNRNHEIRRLKHGKKDTKVTDEQPRV